MPRKVNNSSAWAGCCQCLSFVKVLWIGSFIFGVVLYGLCVIVFSIYAFWAEKVCFGVFKPFVLYFFSSNGWFLLTRYALLCCFYRFLFINNESVLSNLWLWYALKVMVRLHFFMGGFVLSSVHRSEPMGKARID